MVLGKLDSTLSNGRTVEMEFAAQVLFQEAQGEPLKARHYKVWAVSNTLGVRN